MATGTLLLNGDYSPLRVVSLKRGVSLVLAGKAEVIEEDEDEVLRSSRMQMAAPTVIRLTRFVKVPYRATLPLTRKNLIARDLGKCGYCGRSGNTIDHIIPRSRGGRHEWNNVVLACSPCNGKKGDKLLSELRWELRVTPKAPRGLVWFVVGLEVDPTWQPYLAVA
jgi:5-methylcytosine-specific restriction endonuclease McrA